MRMRAALCALAMMAISSIAVVLGPPTPALAVSCPDSGWTVLDGRIDKFFAVGSVNIRTGPATTCTSVGQGQTSHNVQLDCWKDGEGGTWSHLFDFATSVSGWSRDDLLVGGGANVQC
jgi:hypothetical protein